MAAEIGFALGWSVLKIHDQGKRKWEELNLRVQLRGFNQSPFTHDLWRVANEVEPPENLNRGFIGETLRYNNTGTVMDAFDFIVGDSRLSSILDGLSESERKSKIEELSARQRQVLRAAEKLTRDTAERRGAKPDEINPRYLIENSADYVAKR
ncbi:MAG TPA: hypothetical protein VG917_04305 [Patescibacteria group bacterium]|nr:hypothetical protein [Patescibacteria group bacterium]